MKRKACTLIRPGPASKCCLLHNSLRESVAPRDAGCRLFEVVQLKAAQSAAATHMARWGCGWVELMMKDCMPLASCISAKSALSGPACSTCALAWHTAHQRVIPGLLAAVILSFQPSLFHPSVSLPLPPLSLSCRARDCFCLNQ